MATVNFLYRSNKPEAKLILRLLFRFEGTDFVMAENTKISVSKEYWSKYHKSTKISDTIILNTRTEVNNKINEISTFILNEFEKYNPTEIDKKWLTTKIDNFYNPKKIELIPKDLVSFFDSYLKYRRNELNLPSVIKYLTDLNER